VIFYEGQYVEVISPIELKTVWLRLITEDEIFENYLKDLPLPF
jgi:hypothetical protein